MNKHLETILNFIQQSERLSDEEKNALLNAAKAANKELEITAFKLDRTEKVKRTTAILLEETIEELEQKRKAVEAQNRDLEIEAALERVRTVAMSMNKTDDVLSICKVMFTELKSLGFDELRNALINFWDDEHNALLDYDYADFSGGHIAHIPYNSHPTFENFQKRIRSATDAFAELVIGEDELESWKERRRQSGEYEDPRLENIKALYYYFYSIGVGAVGISTFSSLNEEKLKIIKRFRNVFDLAYRRYIDIQKAEAQAREAQIQLALERVRARTMAMQQSNELPDAANILFQQIQSLGMPAWSAGYCIWNEDKSAVTLWMSSEGVMQPPFTGPTTEDELFIQMRQGQEHGETFHVVEMGGEQLVKHYLYMRTLPVVGEILDSIIEAGHPLPTFQIMHHAYFSKGFLLFITYEPVSEAHDIFKRFANVFEQTYTRFLDLQKAEAQAREAQIQLALERVRARTMAMHKSEELSETSYVLFQQLKELGEDSEQTTIGIFEEDYAAIRMYSTTHGSQWSHPARIPISKHSVYQQMYLGWKDKLKSLVIDIGGKELEALNKFKLENADYQVSADHLPRDRWIIHNAFFSKGIMAICTISPRSAESIQLFERFAQVFDLTYTRFLDLQNAEAQAREAQIEAALEKVRSRTLAMQKSDELAETAAVLFQQLIALGIEPNRLYIAIVKDEQGESEFWITEEDGTKVSTAFAADLNKNESFIKMFDGWKQQKKSLVLDMEGEELQNYFRHLTSLGVPFKGGLQQKRRVQDIAYFSNGFIGMASPDEQPAETLLLLERSAAVFNLTFTRFNDLKIAEAHALQAEQDLIAIKEAKQKAEEAFTELQAAQKQLIQSEKMASLGELTAGIAHEIQNPLNFVNNFSEVSNELIDEMNDELNKGDIEEAKLIAADIQQNLEKINHHGKRAEAIVKGMLQHSRTSSGQKELTDLNTLADEYLRLAYHGLRAKDKTFNATLKTNYDESVGAVNIIPQDIGRVVLNLINNAFYAVAEKGKQTIAGYEPTVEVETRKEGNKVLVRVKDNGSGIPQIISDKIFQPFFTTKPTGQGTGLGLSLSYDIIKAHGGEIKVKTQEGEGTEFCIVLPT